MALFTYPEAAEYLGGISTRTLRRWVKAGLVPVLNLGPGGIARFDQADLDRFKDSAKRRAPQAAKR